MYKIMNCTNENSKNFKDVAIKERRFFSYLFFGTYVVLFSILIYIQFAYEHPIFEIVMFLLISFFSVLLIFGFLIQRKTFVKSRFKSAKLFFEEIGYEQLVTRYNNIQYFRREAFRLLIVSSILFGLLFIWLSFFATSDKGEEGKTIIYQISTISFIFVPAIVLYSLHVIKNRFTLWNDFDFFHAFGCFFILSKFKDLNDEIKLKLIINALNSYNNYLRNEFRLHFTNVEQLYVKILSNSTESMNKIIDEIKSSLKEENTLELLRYLDLLDSEQKLVLVHDQMSRKVQEWLLIILGPLVTIIIFAISIGMGFKLN